MTLNEYNLWFYSEVYPDMVSLNFKGDEYWKLKDMVRERRKEITDLPKEEVSVVSGAYFDMVERKWKSYSRIVTDPMNEDFLSFEHENELKCGNRILTKDIMVVKHVG